LKANIYLAYVCAAGGYTASNLAPLLQAITDAKKMATQPCLEKTRNLSSISKGMGEVEELHQ